MPKDSTDSIHLVTRGHWTKWFLQLQHLCVSKGIWKDVKPTREKIAPLTPGSTPEDSKDFIRINPDYADDWLTKDPPHLIEISELIKRNDAINTEKYNRSLEHHKAHSKDDEGDEKMQLPPTPSPCTFQDISAEYSALQGEYRSKRDTYNLMHKSYQDVYQWITETVDSSHLMEITIENDNSTALPLRMIILKLHDKLAPTLTTAKSAVAQEYRNVLQQAVLGRSDPIKWHNDWTKAYTNAKAYHVEVDDDLALINFLQAVGTRMLPTWSSAMLIQIETNNQLGLPNYSLKQYGDIFGGLAYQDSLSPKGKGIFSTLSPSTNKPSNQAVKPHEFRSKEKNYRRHPDPYRCPCRAEADWKNNGSDSKHLAKDCEILQYVFTGKTGSLKTPNLSVKECNDIRHRAKDERWNSIRKIWGNKNWIPSSVATSSTNPIDPGARFNACLIQGQLGRGIYNTMESTPHPLTQCTVFDTGGAMHLVNDISLLDGQEYAPSPSSDYVESGTTRIPIIGRGTRTIKGITTRPDSEPNGDLILSNVAYIPGFHVNIVSETKLREAGLWFLGIDSTLRYGTLNNNSIVIQCIRKDNLLFLEYKPFSSYSQSLMNIPVNPSILMCPTINKKINRSFRKSYDPPKPREDSAELWHERSGHLGKEALEHLVFAARNVKIKGITRSDCADCARTHAKQVISRSPSERRPYRPFYKIQWDLFDFPRSYTGSSWLLIIKEMYSGKIFSFPLYQKTHLEVFNTIQSFLAWVLRKYNLPVVCIKQDNDTSVIGIMGNTIFENWIKQEGIELELSPPNTHESNGGSERAGQEIITKQIKMRISAGLPDRLWVEAAQAATYLYNISPRKACSFKSPNEVLESWFQNYYRSVVTSQTFREVISSPEIDHLTSDLRPSWSNIYRYGCRAYPLNKERELGINKKMYKTNPRAHIGYLVGYVPGSSIFRIWIPKLKRVIVTRNVTFDEKRTYKTDSSDHTIDIFTEQELQEYAQQLDIQERLDAEGTIIRDEYDVITSQSGMPAALSTPTMRTSDTPTHEQDSGVNLGGGDELVNRHSRLTPQDLQSEEALDVENLSHNERFDHDHTKEAARSTPITQPTIIQEQIDSMDYETTGHATDVVRGEYVSDTENHPTNDSDSYSVEEVTSPPRLPNLTRTINQFKEDQLSLLPDQPLKRQRVMKIEIPKPTLDPSEYQIFDFNQDNPQTDYSPTHQHNTRRRLRLQEQAPKPSNKTLIGTLIASMSNGGSSRIKDFHETFWPSHPITEEGDDSFVTVHSVIAAAIRTKPNPPTLLNKDQLEALPKVHLSGLPKPPKRYQHLKDHFLGPWFKHECEIEINNLKDRKTWHKINAEDAPIAPIPLQWVFTYKCDEQGFLTRCRARLVVRGDLQAKDTIESTYAATLAGRSFRIVMALIAKYDLETKQFDVVNAFVNAHRDPSGTPVVCYLPDGFKEPNKCVVLDRALYGLRDSPAIWFKDFSKTLKAIGLNQGKEEPCLFTNPDQTVLVLFFVDDIQIIYHKKDSTSADQIISGIKAAYELRELGDTEWFLGIRILRDREMGKLWLAHDTYIEKIAKKFELDKGNACTPLPLIEFVKFDGKATTTYVRTYQEKVGSVLYTAITVRPDAAFAASQLSHYLTNPSPDHMKAVDHCIQYLWNTRYHAIEYSNDQIPQLLSFSDASFADDQDSRRSSQGYIISLFGGPVVWKASRQDTVTTSTTEAELLGVERTSKETLATLRFLKEINLVVKQPVTIFCDNQQSIRLVVGENERITTKLRHVDIQNMWLRQEYAKGNFYLTYLPTAEMAADGLTKNLSRQKFGHFIALLNLQDVSMRIKESR